LHHAVHVDSAVDHAARLTWTELDLIGVAQRFVGAAALHLILRYGDRQQLVAVEIDGDLGLAIKRHGAHPRCQRAGILAARADQRAQSCILDCRGADAGRGANAARRGIGNAAAALGDRTGRVGSIGYADRGRCRAASGITGAWSGLGDRNAAVKNCRHQDGDTHRRIGYTSRA